MAGIALSGLASGFDWQSLVNQLMTVAATPITRLQTEKTTNSDQVSALSTLGTQITALQTAVKSLKDQNLFSGRLAASSTAGSTWQASADPGATVGTHSIAVTQLATKALLQGVADFTGGINSSNDVSALTIATMRTGTAVTAGTFTINGAQVTVATTDTLQQVFDHISTATGGAVTAGYDSATDKVTLTSASAITLGASNDTSNFRQVMKLSNGGGLTATSTGTLGAASLFSPLSSAGLRTTPTVAAGTFTINGVSIAYDTSADSLDTIIRRINASGAGVTASYDTVNDRMALTNGTTGDLGMSVSDSGGDLLNSLGLTTGGTVVSGKNAEYTIDGGATLVSNSNTLDATSHGIPGLSVTVDSATTQTVGVTANTDKMTTQINAFITAYNNVTSFIDAETKITASNGSVSTATLSGNREVQAWDSSLRSQAFNAISSVSATVSRLSDMGIDFTGTSNLLSVTDSTKLANTLQNNPADVEAFFTSATTGFAAQFDTMLTSMASNNTAKQTTLTQTNSSLDTQIADIQRRLDQQRQLLTNSFIAMEDAQSQFQQQSAQLTNMFGSTTSSSSSSSSSK